MEQQIDQQRAKEFARRLLGIYTGCALTKLIDVGHQTGLFDAASKASSTSQELAERAGLNERYVREWLGAMTTGGIFTYDPASRAYSLPPEHAVLLCGDTAPNLAPMSQMLNVFGRNLPQLLECFRHGGGIPYSEFQGFTRSMEDVWRRIYDQFSSNVEENIGNPFAPLYYGISVMHCMTVSLAEGGAGLGTMWGIQVARRMLNEAGFTHVEVVDSPRPQNCIFVCRKENSPGNRKAMG